MSNLITNHWSQFLRKNLHRAPKRLHSMMPRLQRYELLVSYVSDKPLYLADTLSRAFKPSNQLSPQSDIETVCMIATVPMTENRISEIPSANNIEPELQLLKTVIRKDGLLIS